MGKVYCFSDLHGIYELWAQIRDFAKEDDHLVCLGDVVDRGPDGIKILQEIMNDDRVTFLYGNHEDFLFYFATNYNKKGKVDKHDLKLWAEQGGGPTAQAFLGLDKKEQLEIIDFLENTALTSAAYVNEKGQNILLSHAGYTPGKKPEKVDDLIWDRDHCCDFWPEEGYENTYIIHGHTCCQDLEYFVNKKHPFMTFSHAYDIWFRKLDATYAQGHKICIDAATYATGYIPLLDLDTLTLANCFYTKEVEEKDEQREKNRTASFGRTLSSCDEDLF